VDDDPRHIELIAVRLLGLASVLRANGGEQAIEAARRDLPDLLLLDLMMPEVNGFDVVKALNERPETARIPILVLTAKDITEEGRARLKGDVVAIVNKVALDGDGFRAEVRRAVSGRRLVA
jgi:CheY-like chemotaxis protein